MNENALLTSIDNLLFRYYRNMGEEENRLEEKRDDFHMCVHINDTACNNYLSYSFDKTSKAKDKPTDLFPFFNKVEDAHKMCDYILFCPQDTMLYVLLIELKKGNKSTHQQLRAGRDFANFILATLRRMNQLNMLKPQYRFISLRANKSGKKTPVRPKQLKYSKRGHIEFSGSTFPLHAFLK